MNERWKYQIKTGLFWAVFMSIGMSLFDLKEMTFTEAFISRHFVFRFIFYVVFYTFTFGYLMWKQKVKREKFDQTKKG